jgi:Na+-driven multidrug efflux pump
MKEYGRIGVWSGLESLVRNVAFMLMVSRLVNVISEQGTYWIANNFIWTWLLLPATALYDVIKKETAENKNNITKKTLGCIVITTIFSILWFASIPLWKPFLKYVMNVQNYDTVIYVCLVQSGFYIAYMFNCVFDGTIYGRGKTLYMLIQSVCTNCVYYVIMFVLWKCGIFVPTLLSISLMFGIGMALDLIPTIGCYIYLLKKENAKIQRNLCKKESEEL